MWFRLLLLVTMCCVARCQQSNAQCGLISSQGSDSSDSESSFVSSIGSVVLTSGCMRDAFCDLNTFTCVCKRGFSGDGINCAPMHICKRPWDVTNGNWTRMGEDRDNNQIYPGDRIEYTCNTGYAIKRNNGQRIRTCLPDGSWDLKKSPVCVVAKCDAPDGIIVNGNSTAIPGTKYPRGGIVEYSCLPGYRIVGSTWQSCISLSSLTGRWSNRPPTCEEVTCHDVGYPDNCNRIGSPPFFVGDEVRFRCMGGYSLIGSNSRTCQENGKWSGYITICDNGAGDCRNPGTPINGRKHGRRYNRGDVVTFHCDTRFAMIGSSERTCLDTGEWSGNQPTCRGAGDYDEPESVAKSLGKKLDKFVEDTTSTGGNAAGRIIDLNYGGRLEIYIAIDGSPSITKTNFARAIEFSKTLVKKTGVSGRPKGPRYGALTYTSKKIDHFDVTIHENEQDVLNEFDRFDYPTVAGTSTRSALLYIYRQMIPLSITKFEVEDSLSRLPPKRVVIILTDGASNTGGSPIDTANLLKNVYDVEIYVIGVRVTEENDELIGMASTELPDQHIFILQDYNALERLAGVLIGNTIDYSVCGIAGDTGGMTGAQRGRISGGTNATEGAWPWQALIWFSPETNGRHIPAHHSFCGASVISDKWILTAAHCFYDHPLLGIDKQEEWHKNILIGLGYTVQNPKQGEEKPYTRHATVKRVITHPDYDNNYDHDIALLELDKHIVFNNYIQPVCLPSKTDLAVKGDKVAVTGWGNTKQHGIHESATKNTDYLQQVFLSVIKWSVCKTDIELVQIREDLKGRPLTENMICVGGGNSESACKGDSGGPVVKKVPPSNDRGEHWVQFGIVSFGYGCGVNDQHDIDTNVVAFIDWIQEVTSLDLV